MIPLPLRPIMAACALALPLSSLASGTQVLLTQRTWDAREPAQADFLDCQDSRGPCQAVALPRVMADEKVVLPRNKPLESLRFLSLKGIRAQGGDPQLTLGLYAASGGDSVFADLNNDEDLGNDGPARFWPKGDSCVTVERIGGGLVPVSLCRPGAKAKSWKPKCESLKSGITWAMCEEAPVRVRLMDIAAGHLESGGRKWKIGLCDADGDGRFSLEVGDRLLVDWDFDGSLEKAAEADGINPPAGAASFRVSLDSTSYEVGPADEKGAWVEMRRLYTFDPAAAAPQAVEGRKAPDLKFVNMDGDTVRLSDFHGKKVLVHFFSTLCKPCLENLNGLRNFHKGFAGKNWQIISLTTETELGPVQQAVLKHKMDWMVGMAGPEARRYYANRPLPVQVKINEQGMVENRNLTLGARSF